MHHPRLRSFGLMVALVSLLGGGLVPVLERVMDLVGLGDGNASSLSQTLPDGRE